MSIGIEKARQTLDATVSAILAKAVSASAEASAMKLAFAVMPDDKKKAMLGLVLLRIEKFMEQNDAICRVVPDTEFRQNLDDISVEDLKALGEEVMR